MPVQKDIRLRSNGGENGSSAPAAAAKMQIKKTAYQEGDTSPPDYDKMKQVFKQYDGFGMLSLVRALSSRSSRGWRSTRLALIGVALLVGQWVGPVGYVAHKLVGEDVSVCPGDATIWERLAMGSVSLIYLARLSLMALSHENKTPREIVRCNMPHWWSTYEEADRVVTTLLYDTIIALMNLFLVFQDGAVDDMIIDVLALGFFTLLDDEFKGAILEYDSDLLVDLTSGQTPAKFTCRGCSGLVPYHSLPSGGTPQTNKSSESLSAPLVYAVESTRDENNGNMASTEGQPCVHGACIRGNANYSPFWRVVVTLTKVALNVIAAVCRYGGPACAFFMIFYGPICVGGA